MLAAGTSPFLTGAFVVALTGVFSLIGWIILQIQKGATAQATTDERLRALEKDASRAERDIGRIEKAVFRTAWGNQGKHPPDPPTP